MTDKTKSCQSTKHRDHHNECRYKLIKGNDHVRKSIRNHADCLLFGHFLLRQSAEVTNMFTFLLFKTAILNVILLALLLLATQEIC